MKLRKLTPGHYETDDGRHAVCRTGGIWYVAAVAEQGRMPVPVRTNGRLDSRYVSATKRGAAALLAWELAKSRASA
jgi:hypothetical protein